MFKKVLIPILLILAAMLVLGAIAYWYEQKWGTYGPFPPGH